MKRYKWELLLGGYIIHLSIIYPPINQEKKNFRLIYTMKLSKVKRIPYKYLAHSRVLGYTKTHFYSFVFHAV